MEESTKRLSILVAALIILAVLTCLTRACDNSRATTRDFMGACIATGGYVKSNYECTPPVFPRQQSSTKLEIVQ